MLKIIIIQHRDTGDTEVHREKISNSWQKRKKSPTPPLGGIAIFFIAVPLYFDTQNKNSYKQLNFKHMTNFRLNLRKVAMIVACLAVTMMFAACDNKKGDDDNGNGGGNGKDRELTNEEKKLVGDWVWGTFVPGMWYDLGNCYEEFRGSSSYVGAYKFDVDGTYRYVWVTAGTDYYDGYGIVTGIWGVPSDGKLLFTNRIENWTNTMRPDWSTVNKKVDDQTMYYVFKTNSKGENGVSIESDAETAASSNEILAPVYVKH